MAIRTAGHLAELMLHGKPTSDAFEESLSGFFQQLRNHDIQSGCAHAVADAFGDDVWPLAAAITSYSAPKARMDIVPPGRATAKQILPDNGCGIGARRRGCQENPALTSVTSSGSNRRYGPRGLDTLLDRSRT